ncbi:hypothetical protein DICVIV_09902 [Dictyocaulus viviparus]|uniref:Edg1 TPR repeats region domain-containing protein n=1 Tax=Dictyocaulus viviparus TaxID=29172 RepID=A0A0D8XJZ3_DICVI|nr:hypothetical protein DICVIV_09902 [Dictyocaulus viviparus]
MFHIDAIITLIGVVEYVLVRNSKKTCGLLLLNVLMLDISARVAIKLEEFEATMIHGKDLFASTQNLLFYSFGSQGFLDIFRLACSNQKYLGRCTEISRKLCNAAISSLEPLLDTTRHPDKRDEIIEHMQVFWEVLEDASVGVVDVASINELSNFQLGENIVLNDAMNIISWWISVMDNHSIWPWDTVSTFLAMLENFFQSLPEETMIFRFCGILFQLTFKSEKVTQEYVPILIDSIIRIFEEEVDRLTNTERQNNFVYLLCSLCRRKRGPLAGKFGIALTVEKPILAGNVLLRLFILPNIMKRIHELVMLKLFHRLIQQMGVKDTYFEWETAFHGDRMDAAQTPELLLLITKLLIEYEYKNKEIATVCQSLLKSLGEKLRYDDVVFDMKTVEFILFSLQCRPWWVRYAICTWFSHTLSAPVQQIPSGLYKSLSLDHQEHFEEISVDMPFSHVQCFFRSLFELALFDVDLSLDILHKGIAVLPRDENLIEKIAISLVDSCEQSSYRQNITSLVSLLSELLKRFDPSQEVRFVEPVCESTYHGLRLIRNILLIATSVKFAYHKINLGSSTSGSSQSYIFGSHSNSVADDLLQAFCQLTKIHVDKEVVNFRRSILPHPPDIKQPTSSLLVLINCLAEYIVEFQNLNVTKCLDDFSPDHYKANTVYAIAQTDVTNQLKDNQKECGQKSKPGCNTAVPCRTKVDTMHTFATARQINALNIRRLAENRLLKRGISPNKSILISDFSDVPGQNRRKRRIAKHQ